MRLVELTENELLLFQQDVTHFKKTLDNVDEAVRASAENNTDLLESVTDLCDCLKTLTHKLEQVLLVNERLEKLLNRIEIVDTGEDDTDPNTSINENPRTTDIRELEPINIFGPCVNCKEHPCKCVEADPNEKVCDSCLEDPCICMRQYDEPQVSDPTL